MHLLTRRRALLQASELVLLLASQVSPELLAHLASLVVAVVCFTRLPRIVHPLTTAQLPRLASLATSLPQLGFPAMLLSLLQVSTPAAHRLQDSSRPLADEHRHSLGYNARFGDMTIF